MIKQELIIDGRVFTVRSSTPGGLAAAIEALKRSVAKYDEQNTEDEEDGE